MPGQVDHDPPDLNDLASIERWLDGLPGHGEAKLAAIARLLVRLGRPEFEPDTLVAMLERIRFALLPAVDACLGPLEVRQLPYGSDGWRVLAESITTMRALRTLYRRAAARITRQVEAQSPAVAGEAAAPAPEDAASAGAATRQALPLIRALDLQSRSLAALLVHRVAPLAEDWDELCALGRAVRDTGLLDAQVPDPVAIVKPATARAIFVHPLLLRLAELPARTRNDAASAARFASRLAARIGFRIDAGQMRANPWGPVLRLSEASSVRLDTHRVPRVVAERRRQAQEAGASGAAAVRLLDSLENCWAPPAEGAEGHVRDRLPQTGRLIPGRLWFGLPRAAGNGTEPPGRDGAGARPAADSAYQFGQWERNTIIRLSMGGGEQVSTRETADPMAAAEQVGCRLLTVNRVSVERRLLLPPVALGGLVALGLPGALAHPGASGARRSVQLDPASFRIRLGIVAAIEQFAAPGYEKLRAHCLEVELWPGRGEPVELRVGAARFFDQAWLLQVEPPAGEPSRQLLMAAGLVAPGSLARLRGRAGEEAIRCTAILGRGPGFERVAFDPA